MSPFDQSPVDAGMEMKRIRQAAGLSVREMADLLRYNNEGDLRQMERGKRPISGPIRLCLEAVDDGRINPNTELVELD